jgi:hypothetical protein
LYDFFEICNVNWVGRQPFRKCVHVNNECLLFAGAGHSIFEVNLTGMSRGREGIGYFDLSDCPRGFKKLGVEAGALGQRMKE